MKIIGVDPGTQVTGFGLIEERGSRMVALRFGAIKTDTKTSMPMRLKTIADRLRQVIDDERPDALALEESFISKNPQSGLKLGQARGVIMLVAAEKNLEFAEYAPLKIKQTVVGAGHADKTQVQMMVRNLLQMTENPEPLDASDALAVAITHLVHYQTAARMEKAQ